MTPSLSGRVALVTGASRGIGWAIAGALAGAGALVQLLARTAGDLDSAARAIGPAATVHRCDVTDAGSVASVVRDILARGPVPDILVNNAGLFPLGAIDAMDADTFEQTIHANLVAPFRLLRALLPEMKVRGTGHLITIGSVADRIIFPGNGAYSASKFGQRALHEVLLAELRGTGLRATLVSPAATDTPIWDPVDPDNTPGFPRRAQMLRPSDVADAVLWAVTRPAGVNVDELRISST